MKTLFLLTITSLMVLMNGSAEAVDCQVIGGAALVDFNQYYENQTITYKGSELQTRIGKVSGSSIRYNGKANGGVISYGPYFGQEASIVQLHPVLYLSTKWRPDTYDTCKKRNWRSKCVGWDTHNRETGFKVEYVVKGKVRYSNRPLTAFL